MKKQRIDHIGFGNLRLIQQPEDFCYGVDAVILADFAAGIMKDNMKVMDLGTGNGIIPLIISHKTKASQIIGVEIQCEAAELAKQNVIENDLIQRITIIQGDVKDVGISLVANQKGMMDVVLANPPYLAFQGGIKNENPAKTIARHENAGGLEAFLGTAGRMLKAKGHLFMVHRPGRLVDLFCAARSFDLEPKELRLVSPREGEAPNLLLVHMVKDGGKELKILPPLVVYDFSGGYTTEILKIYEK